MGRKPEEEDPPDWSYVEPLEDEVDPEFELEPEPPHEQVIPPRLFGNGEQVLHTRLLHSTTLTAATDILICLRCMGCLGVH